MKVLLLNGSLHDNGSTNTSLKIIAEELENQGIETEIINIGGDPIRDCMACMACRKLENRCVFDDDIVNKIIKKAEESDSFIFGTPVYYAHPSGRILSVLDRVFYAGSKAFCHKPGAAIAVARRGGTTASFDVLNKYFTISQMPVVSSTYWNIIHGAKAEDVFEDKEGVQTMKNLALNTAWLLKSIEAAKKAGIMPPVADKTNRTNFIR